jgi:WD40 repeat protein/DNA-binding SARP family transcriptional activator
VEVGVLGPLRVLEGDGEAVVVGARERALLAALALRPGEPMSPDRLVDALWGESPPPSAAKQLQNHVLRLRKALGVGAIRTTPAGYALGPGMTTDAARFESLLRTAREAVGRRAQSESLPLFSEALELWRGRAFEELADWVPVQAEGARLEELRRTAQEDEIDARLAGAAPECVADAEALVSAEPLREHRWVQLILALYRSGRQADALRAYQRARETLARELGIEPGPELQALERAVVAQDPSLGVPAGMIEGASTTPGSGTAGVVFVLFSDLAGSTELLERLGDDQAEELRRTHFRLLRGAVRDHGGREVKSLGDGLMVVFSSAVDAIECALDIQGSVGEHNRAGREPLRVRVGLHVGEPIRHEDDFFGTSVVVARRLCDAAVPGQILASELVRDLVGPRHRFAFDDVDPIPVKGLLEPVPAVEILGEAQEGAPEPRGRADAPYKGLVAYQPDDAAVFFGRETVVAELVRRLAGTPLLAVVGASGSGKSSVVRAGLLPAIRDGALPGSSTWPTMLMSPGAHPLAELAAQVSLRSGVAAGSLLHDLETDARALDLAARQILASSGTRGRVVLVIDQFEELFTLCGDEPERSKFIDALVQAVTSPEAMTTVVLALRADFYGRCGDYPDFGRVVESGTALLGPMGTDDIRAAIDGPARVAGLRLEPGLTELVLRDVAEQPGALPLLSHALLETWRRRRRRTLTLDGYREAGGVDGAIAQTAEAVYNEFSPGQQALGKTIFLRLIEFGEGTDDTRRRVGRAELGENGVASPELDDVLATLTAARLVTADEAGVEIAHEALIREWPRLRGWIDDDREGLRIHRHITHAALDWVALARDPAELYRGPRLVAATEWADTATDPGLNPLEHEFLEASQSQQQRQADEQSAQVRRLRRYLVGVAIALVVALVAGTLALVQRSRADNEATAARNATRTAEVGRLVAESQIVSSRNRYLSALLAIAANHLSDDDATRGALLNVLTNEPRLQGTMSVGAKGYVAMAAVPPGTLLAVRGQGTVDFFDVVARRRSGRSIHPEAGSAIAVSPDGRLLATGSDAGSVTFWDVATRKPVGRGLALAHAALWLAFSPDGRRLVTAEGKYADARPIDKALQVWDVDTRQPVDLPFSGHTGAINVAAFSPDGAILATGGNDARVVLHDPRTGATLGQPLGVGSYVYRLTFSPDGRRLGVGTQDGSCLVFDVSSGAQVASLPSPGFLCSVLFSPDGRRLATLGGDTARVWDAATFQPVGPPMQPQIGGMHGAFSPDGKLLAITGFDAIVGLWDPNGHARIAEPLTSAPRLGALYSPDGKVLAVPDPRRVILYDVASRAPLGPPLPVPPGPSVGFDAPARITFSPDGHVLAVGSLNGTIQRFDVATLQPVGAPIPVDAPPTSLAFSPDGKLLASGSSLATVTLIDTVKGTPQPPVRFPNNVGFTFVTFSPDGRRLVASFGDTGAFALDVTRSPAAVRRVPNSAGQVVSAAFSPNGRLLVTGGPSGAVQFRDPRTLAPLGAPVVSNPSYIYSLQFSPDGRVVAASDVSGPPTTRLIDTSTRQPIGNPFVNYGIGGYVSFSADSKTIAMPSPDATILWATDPIRWRTGACDVAGRNLTRAEIAQYLPGSNQTSSSCRQYPPP